MTKIGAAEIWEAFSDPGKPLCVGSGGGRFTVDLYFGRKGGLKGVRVFDVIKLNTVAAVGKLPKKTRKIIEEETS